MHSSRTILDQPGLAGLSEVKFCKSKTYVNPYAMFYDWIPVKFLPWNRASQIQNYPEVRVKLNRVGLAHFELRNGTFPILVGLWCPGVFFLLYNVPKIGLGHKTTTPLLCFQKYKTRLLPTIRSKFAKLWKLGGASQISIRCLAPEI